MAAVYYNRLVVNETVWLKNDWHREAIMHYFHICNLKLKYASSRYLKSEE